MINRVATSIHVTCYIMLAGYLYETGDIFWEKNLEKKFEKSTSDSSFYTFFLKIFSRNWPQKEFDK